MLKHLQRRRRLLQKLKPKMFRKTSSSTAQKKKNYFIECGRGCAFPCPTVYFDISLAVLVPLCLTAYSLQFTGWSHHGVYRQLTEYWMVLLVARSLRYFSSDVVELRTEIGEVPRESGERNYPLFVLCLIPERTDIYWVSSAEGITSKVPGEILETSWSHDEDCVGLDSPDWNQTGKRVIEAN
uniref:Uncharacterized protein n=1 Tax=Cacopsylla melanoneura TaxID=428564 RepID=A0A8D8LS63_9HEMI